MFSKYLALIGSILLAVMLQFKMYAQENDYSLLLNSGVFEPIENSDGISGPFLLTPEFVFGDKAYFLVQFHALPTQAVKSHLESYGMTFYDYIPNYAYYVSVGHDFDFSVLANATIRCFMPIRAEWKKSKGLLEENLPDHALSVSGKIDLNVSVFPNSKTEKIQSHLTAQRWEIVTVRKQPGTYTVRVPISEIDHLAQLPFVRYLEIIPPHPTPDDQEARSLHRNNTIDSDLSGGLKYDGTGVTLAVGDDGSVGPHIDYTGRIDQTFAGPSSGDH